MKASDYIIKELGRRGVRYIFEMSGGMITHLLDSIAKQNIVKAITTHHEQAAAFAAEGMGRSGSIPGIAMATSGPGALNLLTGIGSCYFDSVPSIFITGQVNLYEQKGKKKVRQVGFQETDIVSIVKPITKHAEMVRSPQDLPNAIDRAFHLATSGRPGPVLLDIPMNVQREELVLSKTTWQTKTIKDREHSLLISDELKRILKKSKNPLILVGGGIRSSNTVKAFRSFAEKSGIPVVSSLLGLDAFPHTKDQFVGMIGSYGNRYANFAVAHADLIIVLGNRLDVRQTGSNPKLFSQGKTIIHVDIDSAEINHRVKNCIAIRSHLKDFFKKRWVAKIPNIIPWKRQLAKWKELYPSESELKDIAGINPNKLLSQLSKRTPLKTIYVTDVGQHQMWAAQSMVLKAPQRFLTSGGMGAMGFGLPCAIGAYFSNPAYTIVLIAGDGGFQTNIHELETLMRYKIPIKILILNNKSHGMVRQFQQSYFQNRYHSTVDGYSCPNFVKVASAYGLNATHLQNPRDVSNSIDSFLRKKGPVLMEVKISIDANAYPKIIFGKSLSEMEPKISLLS
jgi:acetolactate synthase-1/2/3 large subunit